MRMNCGFSFCGNGADPVDGDESPSACIVREIIGLWDLCNKN